ncbi:serine hydrolase domain-containing protein [Aquimarina sp. 2304DJ70-9]|uniref:serine hydrolase domain-containing protein n=1 Tax=Aquimarina penaris TaxID=3231044 RepID=UPI0034623D3D
MIKLNIIVLPLLFFITGCNNNNNVIEETLESKIDKIMEQEKDFKGIIHIGSVENITYSKGFGYSNRENKIEFDENTVFDIGSVTKPFTAIGIIKCKELGLLDYQDTLEKFFPEVTEDKKNITIKQLLTHSSGFVDVIGNDYEKISKEMYLTQSFDTQLLFSPGERYEYSNVGFSILGIIIETVSNKSYEEFLSEQVFLPSEMKTAGYILPDYNDTIIANGYDDLGVLSTPGANLGKPNEQPWDIDGPYWHLKGNGGLLMSANDIHQYYKFIKADLIDEVSKQKMYTKHLKEDETSLLYRGFGWGILDTNKGPAAKHNGGNGIFFADFAYLIEEDLFVFLASNAYRESQDDLLIRLMNELSITITNN